MTSPKNVALAIEALNEAFSKTETMTEKMVISDETLDPIVVVS